MDTAEVELVLRNEIDQDQSFITLDLYSEEEPLGREDAGPQRITESQVTIGLPTINALPHSQHGTEGAGITIVCTNHSPCIGWRERELPISSIPGDRGQSVRDSRRPLS